MAYRGFLICKRAYWCDNNGTGSLNSDLVIIVDTSYISLLTVEYYKKDQKKGTACVTVVQ